MLRKRRFTIEEANELLPDVRVHFDSIYALRDELRATIRALEEHGVEPEPAGVLPRAGEAVEVHELRLIMRGLVLGMRQHVAAIKATGAIIKDLDEGLVDFYGTLEGRRVLLSWKYGEPQIEYWSDLHDRDAERLPIFDD